MVSFKFGEKGLKLFSPRRLVILNALNLLIEVLEPAQSLQGFIFNQAILLLCISKALNELAELLVQLTLDLLDRRFFRLKTTLRLEGSSILLRR